MLSLYSHLTGSPPKDLHTTSEAHLNCAHRTKQRPASTVWHLASYNFMSLLDVEGSVRTARQGSGMMERKTDKVTVV